MNYYYKSDKESLQIEKRLRRMRKTIDDYFIEWECHVFGFGYGTGEEHVLGALKTFFEWIKPDGYDYKVLEDKLTPTVAWLLINRMAGVDMIEYGCSPRYGWLTPKGTAMKVYLSGRTLDELTDLCCQTDYIDCGLDYCNNPFLDGRPEIEESITPA